MGSSERKDRHKTELREKILSVSRELLLQEGLAALTLRRVAEKIEYSAGTIYLHFKNRDEIIQELGRHGLETLRTYLQRSARVKDPARRLQDMARQYLRFAEEHPQTYYLIFMLDSKTADAVFRPDDGKGGAGQQSFQIIVGVFAALRATRPEFKKMDPVRSAELYWIGLHGISSLKISCGKFLATPAKTLADAQIKALLC